MLAVKRMSHLHNAEDWNIQPDKVQAISTDNGSNMVKVFRQRLIDLDEDTDVDTSDDEVEIKDKDENKDASEG